MLYHYINIITILLILYHYNIINIILLLLLLDKLWINLIRFQKSTIHQKVRNNTGKELGF